MFFATFDERFQSRLDQRSKKNYQLGPSSPNTKSYLGTKRETKRSEESGNVRTRCPGTKRSSRSLLGVVERHSKSTLFAP